MLHAVLLALAPVPFPSLAPAGASTGPPAICFPLDVGDARTPPWGGEGPGPAFREDAPTDWVESVERLRRDPDPSEASLASVLAGARPDDDALTLWHLLEHPSAGVRESIFWTLARVSPPPEGLDQAALLAGDRAALDRWRHAMPWSW